MMQYSLLDRRPEEESLDLLQQNNIGVLARGSVASGLLVNKSPKSYLNYSAAEVEKAADSIKAVSTHERQPTQSAIQFVLNQPAITSAVVGIRTVEQLEEALKTIKSKSLIEEEVKTLKESLPVNRYEQHR
jgi:aryl-alcohol dehydrogenase-like predicted oxidoreductase